MYPDHLQNFLGFGYGLLIFLILASVWISETGPIWWFWQFSSQCMGGMDWNFTGDVSRLRLLLQLLSFSSWYVDIPHFGSILI